MRVTRLMLQDIGPFDDAVFEIPEPKGPGELVLFVGPNGSGKTTIAQTIAVAIGSKTSASPVDDFRRRMRGNTAEGRVTVCHGTDSLEVTVGAKDTEWPRNAGRDTVAYRVQQAFDADSAGAATPWAAFAFGAHTTAAQIRTSGPKEITGHPLHRALSFGVDGEDIPIELLGHGLCGLVSWLSDLFVRLERTPWETVELSPLEQDFWLILDKVEGSLHPPCRLTSSRPSAGSSPTPTSMRRRTPRSSSPRLPRASSSPSVLTGTTRSEARSSQSCSSRDSHSNG
jgi:energy-coupling factor transporter ATP-binding protein EcfA2